MTPSPDDPDLDRHWTRWLEDRDEAARDHLIVHYSPLVKFVAGRIGSGLPNSVDPGDLVNSGVLGLIDALGRFDRERGVRFETFAAPRIRGAIYDGLRALDWVPRSVRSKARRVEQSIAKLEQRLDRTPVDAEIADDLHITEHELADWLSSIASTTVGPIDRLVESGFEPPAAGTAGFEMPARAYERQELRTIMRSCIKNLPDREKLVLSLYYEEGLTLAEIGQAIGVTESRVSQIHTKSVLHLRTRMAARGAY